MKMYHDVSSDTHLPLLDDNSFFLKDEGLHCLTSKNYTTYFMEGR
jgi:hypothetical protein